MQTTFLTASDGTPLVKNLITKESYPKVTRVNSFTHETPDPQSLFEALKIHANKGNCLIKGSLDQPLKDESRAGHTVKGFTKLLVLDIDHDALPFKDRADFLKTIGLGTTTYIFQFSSKSKSDDSLRGHYYFLLKKEVDPQIIKSTVRALNFKHLYKQFELSSNKAALRWPLDITVNDAGKLIYLAPPIQKADPITERFLMISKRSKFLLFSPIDDTYDIQATINELRENEGLATARAPVAGYVEIKPAEIKVTGVKKERSFVYLNLNGGDSWGYFFNPEQPDTVFNFKGEPNMRLKEVSPELYAEYEIKSPNGGDLVTMETLAGAAPIQVKAIGFRDLEADIFYQVKYNPVTEEVHSIHKTSAKDRLNDFLVTNGEDKLKYVNSWDVEFTPANPVQIDPQKRWLNLFRPTKYLEITDTVDVPPAYTTKLIKHLTVDDESYKAFINWLAFVFQKRKKAGTAWLFHGYTGTGKGTLYDCVLKPIFGFEYTHFATANHVTEDKNAFMEKCLLCIVDEFELKETNRSQNMYETLRTYITEPYVTIRAMRQNQVTRPNYSNFIMYSNAAIPMRMDESDRRLNVAPKQEERLAEIDDHFRKKLGDELEDFCKYLRGIKVDEPSVHRPLMNEARAKMIVTSRTSHDNIFHALKFGDLDFFTDNLTTSPPLDKVFEYQTYERIIEEWVANAGKPGTYVLKEDFLKVYDHIADPNKTPTLNKFTTMCGRQGIDFKRRRIDKIRQWVYDVEWEGETRDLPLAQPDQTVVPFKD